MAQRHDLCVQCTKAFQKFMNPPRVDVEKETSDDVGPEPVDEDKLVDPYHPELGYKDDKPPEEMGAYERYIDALEDVLTVRGGDASLVEEETPVPTK